MDVDVSASASALVRLMAGHTQVQRCTGNALAPDDQEDVYDVSYRPTSHTIN